MRTPVTDVNLRACGYTWYTGGYPNKADALFQKAVKTPDGQSRRYFINFWQYNFHLMPPDHYKGPTFSAEARFYRGEDDEFDVLVNRVESIEDAEDLFEEIFKKLSCEIDRHNN